MSDLYDVGLTPAKKKPIATKRGKDVVPKARAQHVELKTLTTQIRRQVESHMPAMMALLQEVKSRPITGENYATDVTNLVGQATNMVKALEEWRKWAIEPERLFVLEINELVNRGPKAVAQEIKDVGKRKIAEWQQIAELERRKEVKRQQEEQRRVQAAIDKEAKEAGVEAPSLPAAPAVVPEAAVKVKTETGAGVHTRKDWTWKMVEIKALLQAIIDDAITDDYIEVNSKKLNGAVQSGVRSIPGVHIYQKETPIFTGGRRK